MKPICIIQARTGSTRLPKKVLRKVCGKEILGHVIDRVSKSKKICEIIIATTKNRKDDVIEKFVKEYGKYNVKLFRGSEDDVLDRYYWAAKQNNAETIVRITSDCPLIDWNVIDRIISEFEKANFDYISNSIYKRTYPRGLDVEVFTFTVLEKMWRLCCKKREREHVTAHIIENKEKFLTKNIEQKKDYSHLRWTLDEEDDFKLIKTIYDKLYPLNPCFNTDDILNLLEKNPEFNKINQHVEQKK